MFSAIVGRRRTSDHLRDLDQGISLLSRSIQPLNSNNSNNNNNLPQRRRHHHDFQIHLNDEKRQRRHQSFALRAKPQDSDDTGNDPEGSSSSSLSWVGGLVIPLWLVYISNQWSRSSLYYLVDFSPTADSSRAMNLDIGFTEAQYGVLASLAFTALYAVASLAAGVVSDRFNRKTLTVAAVIVWSIATFGTSLASTFDEVFLWRIGMGLACAFTTPQAYTLIAENAPSDRVSLASSLYGTGVALGGALASLSILLDTSLGWRESLLVISIYGLVAATIAAFVLPNDPKDANDKALLDTEAVDSNADSSLASANSILQDVQKAVETPRVKWLFLASFLRFCSGLCIGVWSAPYFRQVFPDHQSEYAVAQALITAVGGSVSGLLGGYAADTISRSNPEQEQVDADGSDDDEIGRKLWIPVVGSLLAAPAWFCAVETQQSFEFAMAWLAVEYFVAECWFGPTISVLQKTVGPKIGGISQGLFTLTGALANTAPSLLGFLYGQQQSTGTEGGSSELAGLLVTGICFGYLSSAFCFAMSALSKPPSKDYALLQTDET